HVIPPVWFRCTATPSPCKYSTLANTHVPRRSSQKACSADLRPPSRTRRGRPLAVPAFRRAHGDDHAFGTAHVAAGRDGAEGPTGTRSRPDPAEEAQRPCGGAAVSGSARRGAPQASPASPSARGPARPDGDVTGHGLAASPRAGSAAARGRGGAVPGGAPRGGRPGPPSGVHRPLIAICRYGDARSTDYATPHFDSPE